MTDPMISIGMEELRERLDAGEPITLLDVRPSLERAEWSIPGSLHLDVYDALKAGDRRALAAFEPPAGTPVVTVCAAGKTSLIAAEQLRARGVAARSLAGGMKAWSLAWNSADISFSTSDAAVIQVRRTGKGCLSYLIGSDGEAAVIDPSLDPDVYLDLAKQRGWTITHILETHVHADHLMRSRPLAERTGAALRLPETDRVRRAAEPLRDGNVVRVGASELRVVAAPGHTLESTSFLLDRAALFTGDTLFLVGVGRPDLEASPGETRQRARLLHRSLQRLFELPATTVVLPGHVSEPIAFDHRPLSAPLGEVRARVAMARLDEDAFVDAILPRIPPTPPNHHRIVELNEAGVFPVGDPTDFEAGANRCAVN